MHGTRARRTRPQPGADLRRRRRVEVPLVDDAVRSRGAAGASVRARHRPAVCRRARPAHPAVAGSRCGPTSLMRPTTPMSTDPSFSDPTGTWNRRFGGDGYLFGTEPNEWLREHAGVWAPGQRVLCVADGEGRNSVWLAQRGLQVTAFDIADAGVAKARRLAAERGVDVDFHVAGCDDFAWPRAGYDGVAAIFVQFADRSE